MSRWLVLGVRFPRGSYDAGGQRGRAEWPPSPERILAAGLAVQSQVGQNFVEALYHLPAPLISAPVVGRPRDHRYSRWVPRQDAKINTALIDKTPGDNAGVLVDPGAKVLYAWDLDGTAGVDAEALAEVFIRVAYLGRPTSAVVVDVELCEELLLPEQPCHVPDPRGPLRVSVPSPGVLAQREALWRLRQSVGLHDARPPQMRRTWQRYTAGTDRHALVEAGRREVALLTAGWRWFTCPPDVGVEAVHALAGALRAAGGTDVLPGLLDRRVVVLGARGVDDLDHVTTVHDRRVVRLQADQARPPRVLAALSPLVSSSMAWTTTMPMLVSDDLASLVLGLTDQAGVVDAVVHDEPKGHSGLWPRPLPGSTNVTVLFDAPVSGPLFLGEVALQVIGAPDDADDGVPAAADDVDDHDAEEGEHE